MYTPQIPAPDSMQGVADWVELYLILNNSTISKSEVISLIEASQGIEPEESFVDSVWVELERRKGLYGENSPFILDGNVVECSLDWKEHPYYFFSLYLSLYGNREDQVSNGRLFELTSQVAVKNYLNCEVVIYSRPREIEFPQLLVKMGEKIGIPIPSTHNDRGVDLIAWRPFQDKRPAQIIVLLQCASGQNWRNKTTELPFGAWTKYACWGEYLLKGFCIAQIVPENEFEEKTYEAGIIFDRVRIFESIRKETLPEELKRRLLEWGESKLTELTSTD